MNVPLKFDLRTTEGLKAACQHLADHPPESQKEWTPKLAEFLSFVKSADLRERSTLEFHQRIWDDNPVASAGQGRISVSEVIESEPFRRWLAERSLASYPTEKADRIQALQGLYEEVVARFSGRGSRIPHLKIFRVLASFFPDDFTTIAHRGALERMTRRMRGVAGETYVALHRYIRDRFDEALGPASTSALGQAQRLELPWYVYALTSVESAEEEKVALPGKKPGEESLIPLPAARRRRGLTALAGGFPAVLEVLQELKDGLAREEFLDYLRVRYPALKEASRRMTMNILRSELGVIKNVNNEYSLTERGAAVLETSSARDLGDWLVTRVLGVDHVLRALLKGPASRPELVALLQKANPGWTSTFAPTAMLNWLVTMEALARDPNGVISLKPIGQEWAEQIDWEPEFLKAEPEEGQDDSILVVSSPTNFTLPPLPQIVKSVCQAGVFPSPLVEELHVGLWSPRIRHFAVLAGISGSGKSLLARKYAEALGTTAGDGPRRFMIQPIQPGWYDPSPLLGYLNPLQKDTYQRTEFLNFLLRAREDPARPYVVILDEMNLSHPEQYFAPLLSAMESEDRIFLHSEGESFDGVPETIQYPANLAIIGTVNMDETTHGLSDKVLDRAYTLEFWEINLDSYPRWKTMKLGSEEVVLLRELLSDLMEALAPARLHFGWRTVDDVVGFLESAHQMGNVSQFVELLDAIVYSKVLPKLRGEDSPRLQKALGNAKSVLDLAGLKRCSRRVAELTEELSRSGSTRFWR
jgi:5-methylcytosine-specific restriction enzyme B